MTPPTRTFRTYARISSLCTVFEATLTLLPEEGTPLHYVHERPVPVVIGKRGELLPRTDRNLAVILGVKRISDLLPHMEEDLLFLPTRPFESLYLSVPAGEPVIRERVRMLNEASGIFIPVAETSQLVMLVAVTHRRRINGAIVIRHYPVAVYDQGSNLMWAHPAGHSYGLIREEFPNHQKVRQLGPRCRKGRTPDLLRRLDDATGLPQWYQFAKEQMQELQDGEDPLFQAVIAHQANLWLQRSIAESADQALVEATQDFIRGFEMFFGAGGLDPVPGFLAFS